ncbi:hypothetical protein A6X21_07010 [Planctopirus hydrillae]|uniref:Uncharacterized protein n=1 Tax=Planctopirus hydrillae TaxID=1841610 RepID=A0A1C3EA37_9PLAN|nr:hypothetical protein A6X21_07010 [Planctopirus hydrillae]
MANLSGSTAEPWLTLIQSADPFFFGCVPCLQLWAVDATPLPPKGGPANLWPGCRAKARQQEAAPSACPPTTFDFVLGGKLCAMLAALGKHVFATNSSQLLPGKRIPFKLP